VTFLNHPWVQDAVIPNFEKRDSEFVVAQPDLPLSFAYQMRNAVAHGDFKVDFEIIWKTIHRDLPGLHSQIDEVQASLRNHAIQGIKP
jgi:uncharacterized protein with HEPN domain